MPKGERITMFKKLLLAVLPIVIVLSLVGCDGLPVVVVDSQQDIVDVTNSDSLVSEIEPANATTDAEPDTTTTVVILIILVVAGAIFDERMTELLKKLGLVKDGYAAVWQTCAAAVIVIVVAISKHFGIENQMSQAVDALVEFASAAALLIPIFGQSVVAKLIHSAFKDIGFNYSLTTKSLLKELRPPFKASIQNADKG